MYVDFMWFLLPAAPTPGLPNKSPSQMNLLFFLITGKALVFFNVFHTPPLHKFSQLSMFCCNFPSAIAPAR